MAENEPWWHGEGLLSELLPCSDLVGRPLMTPLCHGGELHL